MKLLHLSAVVASALIVSHPSIAQDWSGAYGGIGLSANNGVDTRGFDDIPTDSFDLSGNQYGLFVGYNFQAGQIVYGGELAYVGGEVAYDIPPDFYVGQTVEIKGRVGYATGRTLLFASLGWMQADKRYGTTGPTVKATGPSLGLGIDAMVGERMFIGAEYQRRTTKVGTGDIPGIPVQSNEHEIDSLALRLGMRF